MTREEIISNLLYMKRSVKEDTIEDMTINEAIKALEQEPCTDAISRQAVLDLMQMRMGAKELYRAVYDLPPVNPAEKVGQWKRISMDKYVQHAMAYYKCSVCGKDIIGTHNYCPSCGAKMEEVKE